MASPDSAKQETLIYALAAAGVVIVILLGTILFLVSSRSTAVPGVSDIPVAPATGGQQAPALSPDQIEGSGGELPSGHVPVPGAPGAGAPTEGGAEAPAEGGAGEPTDKTDDKGGDAPTE